MYAENNKKHNISGRGLTACFPAFSEWKYMLLPVAAKLAAFLIVVLILYLSTMLLTVQSIIQPIER